MTEPFTADLSSEEPTAGGSPFAPPAAPVEEEKRKKRIFAWLGAAGALGVCGVTLALLVGSTTTQLVTPPPTPSPSPVPVTEAPSQSAPDTPASEAPAPEVAPAPGSLAAQPVGAPRPVRSLPRTVTPGVPVPYTAPSGDPAVLISLTQRIPEAETTAPTRALTPGGSLANEVTIRNDGTVDLRYAMTSTTTANDGDLVANVITMAVKVNVADCSEAGFARSGEQVYQGPLGAYTGRRIVGDPRSGQDAGDRLLTPGEVETLCVKVDVPANVGNEYQGRGTGVHFQFDAESILD